METERTTVTKHYICMKCYVYCGMSAENRNWEARGESHC
jgi:ribosomal protein L40E